MSKHLGHLPKLDALRAIAALMVLCSHYLIDVDAPFRFDYGGYGVQIFFVISGFLITSILLAQKEKSDLPKKRLIGSFITKRALRLFPVYYIVLLTLFVLYKVGNLWICDRGDWWHYFTYTQNYVFFTKGWQSPLLNHTWSLAVEEQFYLVWPFIIFFTPRRHELKVLFAIFFLGITSRIYFQGFYPVQGTVKAMTLIHFDMLGAGALLAWMRHRRSALASTFFQRVTPFLFVAGVVGSGVLTYYGISDPFLVPFFILIMAFSIVFICSSETRFFLNPLLQLKPLQYVGKISYGVYLYHKLVPFFTRYTAGKAGIHLPDNKIFQFVMFTVIALTVASLSWKFIEQPLLRVKERFDK